MTRTTAHQMRQCADAGMSSKQAAEHLGVRHVLIRSAARTLGIRFSQPPRRSTTEAMIRKCAALRMSVRQAAEQLDVDETALRDTASALGISFTGHNGRARNSVTLQRRSAHDPFGRLSS